MTKISIIIPTLNEVDAIHRLLLYVKKELSKTIPFELIVVDGGSTDGTQNKVQSLHKDVIVLSSAKGRAKQLNAGAKIATGDLLYFLHCDSFPPTDFDLEIAKQVKKGHFSGCFRMKFDDAHPVLWVSQWFTRFNHISCRGGDQSLFVTKSLFDKMGGYNENYSIYEDNEIIKRLYQNSKFVVIPKYVITSARRYKKNGVLRLQYHFAIIHLKRRLGHSTESMVKYYKKNIS